VDEFDADREVQGVLALAAGGLADEHRERRPHALPAREHDVFEFRAEFRGLDRGDGLLEALLDGVTPRLHVLHYPPSGTRAEIYDGIRRERAPSGRTRSRPRDRISSQ